jgi:hypothetical protein
VFEEGDGGGFAEGSGGEDRIFGVGQEEEKKYGGDGNQTSGTGGSNGSANEGNYRIV